MLKNNFVALSLSKGAGSMNLWFCGLTMTNYSVTLSPQNKSKRIG